MTTERTTKIGKPTPQDSYRGAAHRGRCVDALRSVAFNPERNARGNSAIAGGRDDAAPSIGPPPRQRPGCQRAALESLAEAEGGRESAARKRAACIDAIMQLEPALQSERSRRRESGGKRTRLTPRKQFRERC